MEFYIHRIGVEIKITNCKKTDHTYCAIGPFKTEEEAKAWVEKHIKCFVSPTATDIRVKEV
jgi:hypothetical protein